MPENPSCTCSLHLHPCKPMEGDSPQLDLMLTSPSCSCSIQSSCLQIHGGRLPQLDFMHSHLAFIHNPQQKCKLFFMITVSNIGYQDGTIDGGGQMETRLCTFDLHIIQHATRKNIKIPHLFF
eukprot:TRINITY_DN27176_c0_g3_i1.p1 TRINITY_DN27176_c0_g3~~TRINITY_DN27176_c0_g3_i1.p1  ORF type:complete len:123 (-),score=10.12 TRINITY_DN27176_c0_g3_i1:784-1152(-)